MRLPPAMSPAATSAATVAPAITRRHGADVGAQPAPAISEREHPAADREAPHARARRGGRERAAEPEQADRGERDLELVAGAEEARAEHAGSGPSSERRTSSEPSARSADVQRHRDRGRQRRARAARAGCGRSRARALRTRRRRSAPRPARRERARRSAAARSAATARPAAATRPGSRGSRRASAGDAGDQRRAPISPSQITAQRRGPRSVSRLRSSDRSAGARVAARLDRLARHVVGDRRRRAARARSARRRWS